jgi:hypothetical protein
VADPANRVELGVLDGAGFSNPVSVIFHALLHPATVEVSTEAVAQHFRTAIRYEQVEEHILDRFMFGLPLIGLRWLATTVGAIHVGQVNAYATYLLLTMLLLLARDWF